MEYIHLQSKTCVLPQNNYVSIGATFTPFPFCSTSSWQAFADKSASPLALWVIVAICRWYLFATNFTQQPLANQTGNAHFSLATFGCWRVTNWPLGLHDRGFKWVLHVITSTWMLSLTSPFSGFKVVADSFIIINNIISLYTNIYIYIYVYIYIHTLHKSRTEHQSW